MYSAINGDVRLCLTDVIKLVEDIREGIGCLDVRYKSIGGVRNKNHL